jgi:phosphatidylinositol glycan class B
MMLAPGWPLGLIFLISFFHLIIRDHKNILVWSILPFIVVHSIVPHKEIRFFFVFINLLPFIFFTSIQHLPSFSLPRVFKVLSWVVFILIALLNMVGLAAMSLKSAGHGRQEISKYIRDNCSDKPVNLICTSWASPYNPWHVTPAKFYLDHNVLEKRINSLCDHSDSLLDNEALNLLVIRHAELNNPECLVNLTARPHQILVESVPKWIQYLNSYYRQLDENEVLILYELPIGIK